MQNKNINSLNRLTANINNTPNKNKTLSSMSLFNSILSRLPRRIRLFSITLILFIIASLYYYWFNSNHPFNKFNHNHHIPTVTRDVLSRLDQLHQSQFQDEERAVEELIYSNRIRFNQTLNEGLPFVKSLPVPSNSNSNSNQKQTCPDQLSSPCSFLLAGYIGEQETKAQIHLHQLGLLALALNRTLVLPQVSKSRMSSCLEYPFDLYYQPDALHRLGVRTLSHEKFLDWFTNSNKIPSARLLAIVNRQQVPSAPSQGSISFGHSSNPNHQLPFKPDRQFCLRNHQNLKLKNKLSFNFDDFPPLTIVAPDKWHTSTQDREKFSERIIHSIRDSEDAAASIRIAKIRQKSVTHPDILVVNYELRYPFLDPTSKHSQNLMMMTSSDLQGNLTRKFQHFPYASIWLELVQSLVNPLPPMIGIHWRQENIPIKNLEMCSKSLVTTLESIKKSYPSLRMIYLSTDYPIEQVSSTSSSSFGKRSKTTTSSSSSKAHSGTFSKSMTPEHDKIMKDLILNNQVLFSETLLTFNSLINTLELSTDLARKLLQLPIFKDLKELDRMMKINNHHSHQQEEKEENEQDGYRRIENEKEIKRLLKEKIKLKITTKQEEEDESNNNVDNGIIGILEKLILVNSSFFLTGVPNFCSKISSFSNHIVKLRQHIIDLNFFKFGFILDLDLSSKDDTDTGTKKSNFNLVEFWS